ncbi:type II secretion system protein [Aquabacterium sp. A3]|uniref:pilus assembly FimT family protein n=1 Tax=Aquabacterium sp. A3 TaxID=3132829 RepID=UPI00311A3FD7
MLLRRRPCSRRTQGGWSLVEVLSTVTIMGVVSASALPRLTEWTQHARTASIEHLAGTLQVAGTMARMRCAIEKGCDMYAGVSQIRYDGQQVRLLRGYPQGGTPEGIARVVDTKGWVAVHESNRTMFHLPGTAPNQACRVVYQAPDREGAPPVIQAQVDDC